MINETFLVLPLTKNRLTVVTDLASVVDLDPVICN